MNKLSKIALTIVTLVSMGSLAACQSTQQPPKPPADPMMGAKPDHRPMMKPHRMTPEQRAQRQAEFEQLQKACDGKAAGQPVQLQLGNQTVTGTCEMRFKPNKADRMAPPPAPPAPANAPVQ